MATTDRAILHIDMDAFFASVEQLDNPELCGFPVIVAGLGRRGVVATCSYEARKFGVRSAMPTANARKLCPEGIYLTPRISRYVEISRRVFILLQEFTSLIEGLSLDEAFLDVSASQALFGTPLTIAKTIKQKVLDVTGLNCSIGVSHNKWLAKFATELGKPDGIFMLTRENYQQFLDPLSVGRLWTVGKVMQEKLERAGYLCIADIRNAVPSVLAQVAGRQQILLQQLANGIDERPVVPDHEEKSVGAETTFEEDLLTLGAAQAWVLKLTERVAERARRLGVKGRVVCVKLRSPPFITETRQSTLASPCNGTDSIHLAAQKLLGVWWQSKTRPALRLLGITLSGLVSVDAELGQSADLFAETKVSAKDQVADRLNSRFGNGTIKRARSLTAREH